MSKALKRIIGGFLGVIVFAVLLIFGFNQIQQIQAHNAKVAAHKNALAAEKKKEKQFNEVFSDFTSNATEVGTKSETIGRKFYDVWQKTIENGSVTISGQKVTDFSDAIQVQAAVFDANGDLDKVKTSYNNLKNDYAVLEKNVTKKNEDRFNQVKELYDSLSKFYNLSTSPTGSLNSFTEDFNQYDNDVASQLQAIQK